MKNKRKRKYGFKYSLDIKNYPQNAAKNFPLSRIIFYTCFSVLLTVLLAITTIKAGYTGKALLFSGIAFILILGYSVLNIMALIIKLKNE